MCLLYVHVYGSMHIHSMFTEVTGGFQVSHPLHLIPLRQSFSLTLKLGWQSASPSNVLLVPPTALTPANMLFPVHAIHWNSGVQLVQQAHSCLLCHLPDPVISPFYKNISQFI